jgi:hypothetical protein
MDFDQKPDLLNRELPTCCQLSTFFFEFLNFFLIELSAPSVIPETHKLTPLIKISDSFLTNTEYSGGRSCA